MAHWRRFVENRRKWLITIFLLNHCHSHLLRDSGQSRFGDVSSVDLPPPSCRNTNIIQSQSTKSTGNFLQNPYVQQSVHTSPSNVSLAGSIIDGYDNEQRQQTLYDRDIPRSDLPIPEVHGRIGPSPSNVSLAGSIMDKSTRLEEDDLDPYGGGVQQDLRTSPSNVSLAGSIDLTTSAPLIEDSDDENCPPKS
ncbi:hypothetical protein FSP39_014691 [Pinctada imbricata]|uniref:Uncharacterized protein n=1 Tax=Pinctada imbricata TaxID=66713 RepID=A0AA88XYX6_PINIB|nr:hypothetical protein FSP39_014691 [Pinctada imbricata]